ncbi:enoyl-CoA hydratase [Croceicoccus estronivorus]|uniref:enoyl-CoA hydratase/isomerase family protein n=1 Tax=Croceicoccus estronivorus TaxID=1172626 RepID=UPI00082DF874|nr:enoyl-CoA hydratase/isomerase family protein [Croceicoccus estronivorus]OCC24357.1 enoyl-CoA hydratase [Croceicoccus estronivorus]
MLRIDRLTPTLEWLTIDRPPANALTYDLLRKLVDRFAELANEADAPAIVLTGAGERFFCAGGDIGEVAKRPDIAIPRMHAFHRLLVEQERYGAPVISAVNGYAVGAGIELILHSDYVVASENAQFGFPEINNGLLPAAKGMRRAMNCIGRRVAEQMLYTGELVGAAKALEIGLINEVVSLGELHDRAREQAEKLRAKDVYLFAAIKRTLTDAESMTDDEMESRTIDDMAAYMNRSETAAAREQFLRRKAK